MKRSKKENEIEKKIRLVFRDIGFVEKVVIINMLECSVNYVDIIKRVYDKVQKEYYCAE